MQKKTGMVGPGFSAWLPKVGLPATQEPKVLEWVAAQERLKCYRRFGADVLAEARPTPTREYAALLNQDERGASKRAPVPEVTCLGCGTVLPMSGQCDTCSWSPRLHRGARPADAVWRLVPTSCRVPDTVAAAVATGHTCSMDSEADKQERVRMVRARARQIWPNETAEEWLHGFNDVLEGVRTIDLVRRARADELLAALEVERA